MVDAIMFVQIQRVNPVYLAKQICFVKCMSRKKFFHWKDEVGFCFSSFVEVMLKDKRLKMKFRPIYPRIRIRVRLPVAFPGLGREMCDF